MLVLPPWGSGGAAAEAAEATATAVEDAAAGAGQPGGEALEGGLFVGADLTQAQVGRQFALMLQSCTAASRLPSHLSAQASYPSLACPSLVHLARRSCCPLSCAFALA